MTVGTVALGGCTVVGENVGDLDRGAMTQEDLTQQLRQIGEGQRLRSVAGRHHGLPGVNGTES